MKGFKIALIIVLGCLTVTLLVGMGQIISGNWQMPGYHTDLAYGNWNREAAILQRTTTQDRKDISQLVIDCSQSPYDVILMEGEGEQVIVEEYCTRTLEEEELARFFQSGSTFSIVQDCYNNGIRKAKRIFGRDQFWGYLRVYLPAGAYASLTKLQVSTSSGDIRVPLWNDVAPEEMQMQNVELGSSSGDILVDFIKADAIIISSASGNHTVKEAEGYMELSASSGDITVGRAESDLQVSTSSGNITLEEVNGSIIASSSSGDHRIGNVAGDVRMESASGDQTLDVAGGDVKASANSGYITVGEVGGSLMSITSSGNHKIGSVAGNARTESTSGDQTIEAVGRELIMRTSSGTVRVESLCQKAEFVATSGDVWATVQKWGGDISISTSSGDVHMNLPQEGSFQFEAVTSSGTVDTFFRDALTYNERETSAKGTIGSGAYHLQIGTTSGSVAVRKL